MKKQIFILIVLLLISNCWGSFVADELKNAKKVKNEELNNPKNNSEKDPLTQPTIFFEKKSKINNLQYYAYAIFRELNAYRRKQHYYPKIRWTRKLMKTSKQEVNHVIKKRSFGLHANFLKWRTKLRNKDFTEIALQLNIQGKMPSRKVFAKTIIESIKDQKEWYLIHPYTHGAVSLKRGKKKNSLIIVIHLARFRRVGRRRRIARLRKFKKAIKARKSKIKSKNILKHKPKKSSIKRMLRRRKGKQRRIRRKMKKQRGKKRRLRKRRLRKSINKKIARRKNPKKHIIRKKILRKILRKQRKGKRKHKGGKKNKKGKKGKKRKLKFRKVFRRRRKLIKGKRKR